MQEGAEGSVVAGQFISMQMLKKQLLSLIRRSWDSEQYAFKEPSSYEYLDEPKSYIISELTQH